MPWTLVALLFVAVGACSFDWDKLDPRIDSDGGGTGGDGGTGGNGGRGGEISPGGAGGEGGSGGTAPSVTGCSDDEREAFEDSDAQPNIAGCSGAFDVPGLNTMASRIPNCDRQAGDDGARPDGAGCSVTDLCADGWHVCANAAEVAAASSTGMCPTAPGARAFWVTRQGGPAGSKGVCDAAGSDNLNGCGTGLGTAPGASCNPLDQQLSHAACTAAASWDCGATSNQFIELEIVTKPSADEGGVLCCRDA